MVDSSSTPTSASASSTVDVSTNTNVAKPTPIVSGSISIQGGGVVLKKRVETRGRPRKLDKDKKVYAEKRPGKRRMLHGPNSLSRHLKAGRACPSAWDWLDSLEDKSVIRDSHVRKVYRTDAPAHTVMTEVGPDHRKHCRDNPNCVRMHPDYRASAQRQHAALLAARDKDLDGAVGKFERTDVLRGGVGLGNLGATCYVNSLLQMLFWNSAFRTAVFNWKKPEESDENQILPELQQIFAYLQLSLKSYFEPVSFVHCLGLSHTQQQDAQEFFKLLLQKLDVELSPEEHTHGKSFIKQEFSGKIKYRTTCQNCKTAKDTESTYYELEVSPSSSDNSLEPCLRNYFFHVETLSGNNRYACDICSSHQIATRQIVLCSLPRVLTFHILRFSYDPRTMTRKKKNVALGFPEAIDMSPYMHCGSDANAEPIIYDLQAMVIHRGDTANSGHYITQVKEFSSGRWIQFDDETAEVIGEYQSKKTSETNTTEQLRVMAGEDINDKYSQAYLRRGCKKGFYESKNAYIISYRKRDTIIDVERELRKSTLPLYLRQSVGADNVNIKSVLAQINISYNKKEREWQERANTFLYLYERMSADPVDFTFTWLPSRWLETWFDHCTRKDISLSTPKIDMTQYTCPHGRIDPEQACSMKRINTRVAKMLIEEYGIIGKQVQGVQAMCTECVGDVHNALKQREEFERDQESVRRLLKLRPERESFLVDQKDLDVWLKLPMRREQFHVGDGSARTFNSGIKCIHGNKKINMSGIKYVSNELWSILKRQYANYAECAYDAKTCATCEEYLRDHALEQNKLKEEAREERIVFESLFHSIRLYVVNSIPVKLLKKLPPQESDEIESILSDPPNILYALPANFLYCWRKWMRHPHKSQKPQTIDLTELLCEKHGHLLLNLEGYVEEVLAKAHRKYWPMSLITQNQWSNFTKRYKIISPAPHKIIVFKKPNGKYTSFPPSCTCGCGVQPEDQTITINVRKMERCDAVATPQQDKRPPNEETDEATTQPKSAPPPLLLLEHTDTIDDHFQSSNESIVLEMPKDEISINVNTHHKHVARHRNYFQPTPKSTPTPTPMGEVVHHVEPVQHHAEEYVAMDVDVDEARVEAPSSANVMMSQSSRTTPHSVEKQKSEDTKMEKSSGEDTANDDEDDDDNDNNNGNNNNNDDEDNDNDDNNTSNEVKKKRKPGKRGRRIGSRRHEVRNIELELQDTVGTLRRKIYDEFGLMPSDQDLRMGEVVLSNALATLQSVGFKNECTVDFLVEDMYTGAGTREAGFEGTSLQSAFV